MVRTKVNSKVRRHQRTIIVA